MFFFERKIYQRAPTHPLVDEPIALSDGKVLLKVLTHADNQAFFQLQGEISEIPANETAECFAKRMVSLCEMLWTIRLVEHPDAIIGHCALHQWNRDLHEIAFGGSLISAHRGQGILAAALELVTAFAKTTYAVNTLCCTIHAEQ